MSKENTEHPLVSIITICYNSENYIGNTIESVLDQTYDNIEYIIIDGNSTDNTLGIIKEYEPKFKGRMRWISEPDDGLYDALNKGIKKSNGKIVALINSDDFYSEKYAVEKMIDKFKENNKLEAVYCDVAYVDRNNPDKLKRIWKTDFRDYFSKFKYGWAPCHPSLFIKKEVYKKYGYFNLNYRISADYDLMSRFIAKNNIEIGYVPKILIKMRAGGISNEGISAIIENNIESYNILKSYNIFPYFIFLKPLRKILYVFHAKIKNIFEK